MDSEDPLVAGACRQEALDLQRRLEDLATAQAVTDEASPHLVDAPPAALAPRAGDEAAVDVGIGEEGGKCHGVTVGELRFAIDGDAAQNCGRRACAVRPRGVAASSPAARPGTPPTQSLLLPTRGAPSSG
ncbi:MAG: hypothetical protein QOE72_2050 [Chloroflexota bacterium]|nr:hypothetical protein [Chloroflexota bacterium]